MTVEIEVRRSLNAVDEVQYEALYRASHAPFFYDWRFLRAAERSPLLAVERTFYVLVHRDGVLVALLPVYLQAVTTVDPFGLLARNADIQGKDGQLGLFSHVMHCFDSRVVSVPGIDVVPVLLAALGQLAVEQGATYFGLLNVADSRTLGLLSAQDLAVCHLVDRYVLDLAQYADFPALVRGLPKDGRYEMTRQLRKFEASNGSVGVFEPPFDHRLEQLTELRQQTTARNGTPQYFPAATLARFVRTCEELVRLVLVEERGEVVGGLICFIDGPVMYIWSAGMRYDRSEFSPYTVSFSHAYKWAFALGVQRIEAGRLNARIKTRLGLRPLPLYAATQNVDTCLSTLLPG